jgi:transcription elongation factor Elf1
MHKCEKMTSEDHWNRTLDWIHFYWNENKPVYYCKHCGAEFEVEVKEVTDDAQRPDNRST